MQDKDKSLSRFLLSIDRYIRNHKQKVINEINRIEEEKISRIEDEIINNVRDIIHKELAVTKNKVFSEILGVTLKNKSFISKRREEIVEDLFKFCEMELLKFTNTEGYFDFLLKSIKKVCVFFGSKVEILLRENDFGFKDELLKVLPSESKLDIFVDENIKLGGIKGRKLRIIVDETFDSKLSIERDLFYQNLRLGDK